MAAIGNRRRVHIGVPKIRYCVICVNVAAWGYHRQGYCQAGFTAVLSPDTRRLFIGAVGSWYWQGQLFVQDLLATADLHSTPEGPASDDDSYLGYSSAVGEFSGDQDGDVVVGMPRGNNLTGKVVLFNSSLTNLYNISGEQMGSYFGYSLCVVDVDSDGLDDIVVGAPLYSQLSAKDGSYEKGKVYVFYQNRKHQFNNWHALEGRTSKSRFGSALTTLGDINRDGYGDFAVGAPYAGINEKGAVFIFHGTQDGVRKLAAQEIYAEDISENLSTFGFSMSGGLDMDNNEYPDFLVGAYNSTRVLFFKSRPVVTVTATLQVIPEKINLDEKGCSLLDGTLVSCVIINTCLEYTGIGVPAKLEFEFIMQLDTMKEKSPRVFFLTSEQDHVQNTTAILQKDSIYCKSIYIYITSTVQDKLTPIMVEVNYSIVDQKPRRKDLKPILNQRQLPVMQSHINIQKNCGKDNICVPELQLSCAPTSSTYLIGSQEQLDLVVNVTNRGEDAFAAAFYLEIPVGIDYINVEKVNTEHHVSCSRPFEEWNGLRCEIGNPIKANHTVRFKVLLLPKFLNSSDSEYEFTMEVNSTNRENDSTEYNNIGLIRVPVRVEVELRISGVSIPDVVLYNKTDPPPLTKTVETDIGPEIIHLYDVWNHGPSTIVEAELYILWPTYTISGQHLLYLLEQPEASSFGNCEFVSNVNPLNVTIEKTGVLLSQSSFNVVRLEDFNKKDNVSIQYAAQMRAKRSTEEEFQQELSCGPTLCSQIYCTVHSLGKGDHAYFKVRSRLWTETLKTLGFDELKIASKLVARVTALPYAVQPHYLDHRTYVVNTVVSPGDTRFVRKHVPWWIIIAAVCAGIVLLSFLVLILWKVGFFKRKRLRDELEREPLNKPELNGKLMNGDELL